MSTRLSARNIFPPRDNPELTIRKRSHADPTPLNDFKMATEEDSDPPVPDLQTMKELCQPSLNGRGGPTAPIAIQATNFRLKNHMIQQVQNSCQFHGLSGDDANTHLDKFLHVTQSIKVNGVTDGAFRLYLFPHSLTHHAITLFDRLPRNSINTFEQMAKMFLEKSPTSVNVLMNTFYNGLTLRHHDTINATAGGTFMKRRLEECYDLIKNMTAHHNDWDTSAQRSESSSSITSSSDPEITAVKAEMVEINKNLMRVLQLPLVRPRTYMLREPIKVVTLTNLKGNNQGRNQFFQGASHGQNPPPAYQTPAYQASGYQDPVHQPSIPQPQVVTTTEFTNYMKANDAILKNMQTNMTSLTNSNLELKNMFGQFMKMNTASSSGSGTLPSNTITNPKEDLKGITTRSGTAYQGPMISTTSSSSSKVVKRETEPVVAPVIEPVAAPVSAPKPNQKPSIPYPSRFHDQKLRDKANDQKEKFFQIFQDLNFNISFADALILMPTVGPTIKSLLTNKDKQYELARTPLNEHRMDECLAMDDLGASINLMPLSVWNKLSLTELTPTLMTLKLADWSISRPISVAEDVFIKVGKFHFLADFVVVDFDADPRFLLILGRSFLKTIKALIDVYEGELTLRVGKEAITFNLDQTSRYSTNYNDMTANRIDVIDMACEDDFLLEEVDAFLALENDPTSLKVDHSYYDTEMDILLLEAFLNDDPSLPSLTQGKYLPQVRKELKTCEAKNDKSSIDEPPVV
uniref:Reverse transcriptase domain-containing protein n=1 Tax=Tanacetum cinerariifolium TaxID=118510 RepID=A0A699HZC2_TANCI|nr:hypothetical protein [Tanacetum cinerariifolium]